MSAESPNFGCVCVVVVVGNLCVYGLQLYPATNGPGCPEQVYNISMLHLFFALSFAFRGFAISRFGSPIEFFFGFFFARMM